MKEQRCYIYTTVTCPICYYFYIDTDNVEGGSGHLDISMGDVTVDKNNVKVGFTIDYPEIKDNDFTNVLFAAIVDVNTGKIINNSTDDDWDFYNENVIDKDGVGIQVDVENMLHRDYSYATFKMEDGKNLSDYAIVFATCDNRDEFKNIKSLLDIPRIGKLVKNQDIYGVRLSK